MKTFVEITMNPFKTLIFMLRRYKYSKIIEKFDAISDANYVEANNAMKDGYIKSTIDDLFENENFTAQLRNSSLRRAPDDGKNVYFTWDLPEFVWETVLSSKKLERVVKGYLGHNARLDDMYIKSVKDGLSSVSEGWHDDNVGYRLKLFMVFDVEKIPSGTVLIPRKRPNIYHVRFWDEISRSMKVKRTDEHVEEIRIDYQAGDCLLFDTNLPHRGDYSSTEGTRFCLIAEFIDRDKANALKGKAPCNPGQGKFKLRMPKKVLPMIEKSNLIDKSLVSVSEEVIHYGH